MRREPASPRWVWVTWASLVVALLLGLGVWIVPAAGGGMAGPTIAGVYVDGPVDVMVVVGYVLAAAVLATVAAVMVTRVPENLISWILGAVAVWMVATFVLIMGRHFLHSSGDAQTSLANWLGAWTFVPFVPISLVLMIFPTGSLPSPRWRILPVLAVAGTAGWAAAEATGEGIGLQNELPNPYANPDILQVADVLGLLLLPALIGTVASLVVRYRRSSPDVRLQIRWVALGGVLQVAVIFFTWAAELAVPGDYPLEAVLLGMSSTLIVPVALGGAILRYRLYDIDRLVSRTVSYAVLGTLLTGAYVGGVIATQALLPSFDNIAVAATTLSLAALLNPLRRRLHVVMDRRFNRLKFEADRVVEAFTARIKSTPLTDAESLASDLAATLEHTLAPASIGIWMRG